MLPECLSVLKKNDYIFSKFFIEFFKVKYYQIKALNHQSPHQNNHTLAKEWMLLPRDIISSCCWGWLQAAASPEASLTALCPFSCLANCLQGFSSLLFGPLGAWKSLNYLQSFGVIQGISGIYRVSNMRTLLCANTHLQPVPKRNLMAHTAILTRCLFPWKENPDMQPRCILDLEN